jgi:hypothetical protein
MLEALVPGARYIFLERDAERTIDSLIEGWQAWDRLGPFRRKRFATYRIGNEFALSDFQTNWWCFALIPNWQELHGRTLAEVCAEQYAACTRIAAADLCALPKERVTRLKFEDFRANPERTVEQVLSFLSLSMTPSVLDYIRSEIDGEAERPSRNKASIERIFQSIEDVPAQVNRLFSSR